MLLRFKRIQGPDVEAAVKRPTNRNLSQGWRVRVGIHAPLDLPQQKPGLDDQIWTSPTACFKGLERQGWSVRVGTPVPFALPQRKQGLEGQGWRVRFGIHVPLALPQQKPGLDGQIWNSPTACFTVLERQGWSVRVGTPVPFALPQRQAGLEGQGWRVRFGSHVPLALPQQKPGLDGQIWNSPTACFTVLERQGWSVRVGTPVPFALPQRKQGLEGQGWRVRLGIHVALALPQPNLAGSIVYQFQISKAELNMDPPKVYNSGLLPSTLLQTTPLGPAGSTAGQHMEDKHPTKVFQLQTLRSAQVIRWTLDQQFPPGCMKSPHMRKAAFPMGECVNQESTVGRVACFSMAKSSSCNTVSFIVQTTL